MVRTQRSVRWSRPGGMCCLLSHAARVTCANGAGSLGALLRLPRFHCLPIRTAMRCTAHSETHSTHAAHCPVLCSVVVALPRPSGMCSQMLARLRVVEVRPARVPAAIATRTHGRRAIRSEASTATSTRKITRSAPRALSQFEPINWSRFAFILFSYNHFVLVEMGVRTPSCPAVVSPAHSASGTAGTVLPVFKSA